MKAGVFDFAIEKRPDRLIIRDKAILKNSLVVGGFFAYFFLDLSVRLWSCVKDDLQGTVVAEGPIAIPIFMAIVFTIVFLLSCDGIIKNIKRRVFVFDRASGYLTIDRKRKCKLEEVTRIQVSLVKNESNSRYTVQVFTKNAEVIYLSSNTPDFLEASENDKITMYRIADEIARYIGMPIPEKPVS